MLSTTHAPSHLALQRAIEKHDQGVILEYLRTAEDAVETTNQYFQEHRRAPPPRFLSNEFEAHVWFWPHIVQHNTSRPLAFSLLGTAARCGYGDVVMWFFYSNEHRTDIREMLSCVLPWMLEYAAEFNQNMIVEMLLTSSVFIDVLHQDEQQFMLDNTLLYASDPTVCNHLVAHGANPFVQREPITLLPWTDSSGVFVSNNPLSWVRTARGSIVGPELDTFVVNAFRQKDHAAVEYIQDCVVVDPTVLATLICDVNVTAVTMILTKAIVDVDGRMRGGKTLLMMGTLADIYSMSGTRRTKQQDILRKLFVLNVDAMLRDDHGHTALHFAVKASNLPGVELLVNYLGPEAVHADLDAFQRPISFEMYEVPSRSKSFSNSLNMVLVQKHSKRWITITSLVWLNHVDAMIPMERAPVHGNGSAIRGQPNESYY